MQPFIEFPALGWHFNISDTLAEFSLFGLDFTIKWYGVIIAVGFLLSVIYGLRRAKHFDIDPDRMIDVALVCTVIAFIGARLYYVLFSESRADYFADPITILHIWEGGLGIYGGLIFAVLSGLLMCRLRRVNTPAMLDVASLGFLIGQAIGRWGNFFNQEAFGGNTTLPWGMTGNLIQMGINGDGYDTALPVHPTFLYESLWCALGFVLLHILSKKAYKFKGQIFSLYVIWYGAGRFFIELLRTDSLMLGNMKVSCFVAVLAVLGGLMLYLMFRNRALGLSKTLVLADADRILPEEAISEEDEADDAVADEESLADLQALDGATDEEIHETEESDEVVENGENS
jgi:phosphatidylglycerol:prolipoprotein diacylglycerol transferase